MTLFILDAFQKAFGGTPDEKTVTAFAGAMDSGMREQHIERPPGIVVNGNRNAPAAVPVIPDFYGKFT